jgi:hypothetical protein
VAKCPALLLRTFSLSEKGAAMVIPYVYDVERGRESWRRSRVCWVEQRCREEGRRERGWEGMSEEDLEFIKYRGGIYSLSKAGSSERGREEGTWAWWQEEM